jgi:Endonuclease/Exonuclease/phosphatase family
VFDGPEDRNGLRNHDEIRIWADYVTPGQDNYIYDDNGNYGGLQAGARFIILGDYNADPLDGDSVDAAIQQLLNNPYINDATPPTSDGGPDAAAGQDAINATHQGDPALDTADFADTVSGVSKSGEAIKLSAPVAASIAKKPSSTPPARPNNRVSLPALPKMKSLPSPPEMKSSPSPPFFVMPGSARLVTVTLIAWAAVSLPSDAATIRS